MATTEELWRYSTTELTALAVWNEQDGGSIARNANLAIDELERRANAVDALRDDLGVIARHLMLKDGAQPGIREGDCARLRELARCP